LAEGGPVAPQEPTEGNEWLGVLADDAAPIESWVEAAASLVAPRPGQTAEQFETVARPQNPALDLRGEALRGARPSVTALLERRIEDALPRDGNATCQLAVALMAWDPTAREKLDYVFRRALERPDRMNCAPILALDRMKLGDRFALDRYAEWITLQRIVDDFALAEPLWRYPEDPMMMRASERLFTGLRLFEGSSPGPAYALLDQAELLRVRAFRRAVLSALDDRREVATSRANNQGATLTYDDGSGRVWGKCGCGPPSPSPIVVKRLRICDLVAERLSVHESRFDFERPIRQRSDDVSPMKAFLEAFEAPTP
jgi:hypothetical protein